MCKKNHPEFTVLSWVWWPKTCASTGFVWAKVFGQHFSLRRTLLQEDDRKDTKEEPSRFSWFVGEWILLWEVPPSVVWWGFLSENLNFWLLEIKKSGWNTLKVVFAPKVDSAVGAFCLFVCFWRLGLFTGTIPETSGKRSFYSPTCINIRPRYKKKNKTCQNSLFYTISISTEL